MDVRPDDVLIWEDLNLKGAFVLWDEEDGECEWRYETDEADTDISKNLEVLCNDGEKAVSGGCWQGHEDSTPTGGARVRGGRGGLIDLDDYDRDGWACRFDVYNQSDEFTAGAFCCP